MMGKRVPQIDILRITLITALAFIVGGFVSYPLSYLAYGEESWLMIALSLILRYLVMGIIGCFVLAWQLRRQIPLKKLWVIGVSSILLGILIPVALINQFFYALLLLPGLLIGLVFGMFLREKQSVSIMTATCGIGMLIANIYYVAAGASLQVFNVWFLEKFGQSWTSTMLIEAVPDMLLGGGIALGVGLVLRKRFSYSAAGPSEV